MELIAAAVGEIGEINCIEQGRIMSHVKQSPVSAHIYTEYDEQTKILKVSSAISQLCNPGFVKDTIKYIGKLNKGSGGVYYLEDRVVRFRQSVCLQGINPSIEFLKGFIQEGFNHFVNNYLSIVSVMTGCSFAEAKAIAKSDK